MALAGPSLQVASLPALPIRFRDSRLFSFSSRNEAVTDLSDKDKGKGKELEFECHDENIKHDVTHEREGWSDHDLIDVDGTGKKAELGIQPLYKKEEEEAKLTAMEDAEDTPTDAMAQLTTILEDMGRQLENAPYHAPPPTPGDAQKSLSLRRRFTSAFKKIQSKSKSNTSRKAHVCVICQEPIQYQGIRVPCGHRYDTECLISLFQAAIRDESLFPPRCCKKTIPLSKVHKNFPPSFLKEFVEKSREFSTVKRVYCPLPRCSRFLGGQDKGLTWVISGPKTYTCTCGTVTCSRCKMAHETNVKHCCGDHMDEGVQVVLSLGKKEGWARCPGCRTMIELNLGCFHMTCLCKAEFCYICQARWKTCSCKQWDETRLVAAAEERIDRLLLMEGMLHRPAPVLARWNHDHDVILPLRPIEDRTNRGELVQAAVDELRINHDCLHALWRYRDGGGNCVGCDDVLDRYVYHCMGCHTIACNRCRHNRF